MRIIDLADWRSVDQPTEDLQRREDAAAVDFYWRIVESALTGAAKTNKESPILMENAHKIARMAAKSRYGVTVRSPGDFT